MTTRAGLAGLAAGLLLSAALFYPLSGAWPAGWDGAAGGRSGSWIAAGAMATAVSALIVFAGGLAAAWSGAPQPRQRLWLGALAGGIAALTLFSGLGAATGGALGLRHGLRSLGNGGTAIPSAAEIVLQITGWTYRVFWTLPLGGILLGALGGWRFAPARILRRAAPAGKNDPMMAFNATITAVPAAALAVILAAILYSRLPGLLQPALELGAPPAQSLQAILNRPLVTALLLYLATQLALLAATSHEAGQAEHRCGLDEIKVAAYVGALTPALLVALLALLARPLLLTPLLLACLPLSLGLAALQIAVLRSDILPRLAQMQAPRDPWEARFFGTIAASRWQPLALLCLGCTILIVAPLHVALAAAISIAFVPTSAGPAITTVAGLSAPTPAELLRHLYRVQASAGLGAILILTAVLTALYLFYNRLGRRFRTIRQK